MNGYPGGIQRGVVGAPHPKYALVPINYGVPREGVYFGTQFKGYQGVTQG